MSERLELNRIRDEARERCERALLFTLIDVVGSSYRKVGAHMIVTAGGAVAGSVSAGCIEADLMARLDELFAGRLPQILSYTNINEDEFALNRGCNGDICIYVEEVGSETPNSLNAYAVAAQTRQPQIHSIEVSDLRVVGGKRLYVERVLPPVRLFIFGNQRDAAPLERLAPSLDMSVTVFRKSQVDELAEIVPDERTAVVLMSHDFDRDSEALSTIASKPFPYVGVMGPRYRTEEMLKSCKGDIIAKLSYPVGISIGAEGADEIAVSVMAEIIQTFRQKVKKVATVVLAAGEAKRFGSPKQLSKYNGISFIRRAAVEALHNPLSSQTLVVLGAYGDDVEIELQGLPLKTLRNQDWEAGMGSSIAAAARWAQERDFDGIVIMACDQVLIDSSHMASLVRAGCESAIAASAYAGTFGIPAYFNKVHFAELASLAADRGAKQLIGKYAEHAKLLAIPEAAMDIDTPEQLVI